MIEQPTILLGIFNWFSWIRSESKGSFANSHIVKAFSEARIADGETCIVIDLGVCPGMDSTFMGTLAGMARSMKNGTVQVADASDRNRKSLEGLGLDYFIDINPSEAVWKDSLDAIRCKLHHPPANGSPGDLQRAKICLDAHRKLSEINGENEEQFRGVIDVIEKEIESKEAESAGTL